MLTQQILDKYNSYRFVVALLSIQNTDTHTYQRSEIPWRLVVTSPPLTDRQETRTDVGMGHAGSVPLGTKAPLPSVLTPSAPCVVSSGPRLILLTSGRRQAGEGSVLEFTHPRRLPSELHILAFLLGSFAHDNTLYLEQTIIPPPTPRHHGMLFY